MTFTPIPNGVRIVHLGLVGTTQIVNTVGCENGNGEAGESLSSLAQRHGQAWRDKVLRNMPSAYQHTNTLAYSLEDQSAAAGDGGFTSAQAGANASTGAGPLQACMIASLKTAKRGRTYQGRMYLSPIQKDAWDASGTLWVSTVIALFQTNLNDYKAQVDPAVGNNGRLAVCSKGSPMHGIAPHVEPVTSITVRSYMGTQRRRVN